MTHFFVTPKNKAALTHYWEIRDRSAFFYSYLNNGFKLAFSGSFHYENKKGWMITTYSLNSRETRIFLDRGIYERTGVKPEIEK